MEKIFVFAGTSEGRRVCSHLSERGYPVTAFVATRYGQDCLEGIAGLTVRAGRLEEAQIEAAIKGCDTVIDATHPYAVNVSSAIKAACLAQRKKLIRVIRESTGGGASRYFENIDEVADYLNRHEGNALVTTGSNVLLPYTRVRDFQKRLYIRVLPSAQSIKSSVDCGFGGGHIIAMQGPFTSELNAAMLKQISAKFIVTKDTGAAGGLPEKLLAAELSGVRALIVGRQEPDEGITIDELFKAYGGDGQTDNGGQTQGKTWNAPSFPAFIDISSRDILVVGGGEVAARRVKTLLMFGAKITVIAPLIHEDIMAAGSVKIIKREFMAGDEAGRQMVLAATGDRELNREVWRLSKTHGAYVNVCDDKTLCDFYFPAVFGNNEVVGGLISRFGSDHRAAAKAAARVRALLENGEGDLAFDKN